MIDLTILSSSPSTLMKSFGCIEKTNVTLFSFSISYYNNDLYQALNYLENNPCFIIFNFDYMQRKIVPWLKDRDLVENIRLYQNDGNEALFEFVENLRHDHKYTNGSTKQILLILKDLFTNDNDDRITNALEQLHNETTWNIIISCLPEQCPRSQILPVNRIIPYQRMRQTVNDLIEVIKNPDFDRFEYLKYLKLNNQNLTCLANKTIHILPTFLKSTRLIENIVLILSVDVSLKVVLDLYSEPEEPEGSEFHDSHILYLESEFWKYYLKKNRVLNNENLKIISRFSRITLDGIDQDSNDLYLIDGFSSSRFISKYCNESNQVSIRGKKKFIVIIHMEAKSKENEKKCKAVFGSKIAFRYVGPLFDIGDSLIDLVSKCF